MIATALLLAVVLQNPQATEQGRDVRLIQYPVTPWVTAERSSLAESQALSALLQRWVLQPDGSSEAFSEDECLFGVTRADRIALAAVPQAHKRMQQLIAVQEKEAQVYTLCLTVYEADPKGLDAKLSDLEQLARLRKQSDLVLMAPKLRLSAAQRASLSTGEEHLFVTDVQGDGDKLKPRHRLVWEGLRIEASVLRLDDTRYGVELEAEFAELQRPVRTTKIEVLSSGQSAIEISLPEVTSERSRVAARLKHRDQIAWNLGSRTTPKGERVRIVGLELLVEAAEQKR